MLLSPLLSILFLSILQHVSVVHSANILFYAAVGSVSTRISKMPLMEALAEKGHSVTYLSVFLDTEQDPKKQSKVKTVVPKKWMESMGSWEDHMSFYEERKQKKMSPQLVGAVTSASIMFDLIDMGTTSCEMLYSDPEFLKWAKSVKFDLVVAETTVNDCVYGLIHMWKAKYAMYATCASLPWFPDSFGLPDETSSISEMMLGFDGGHKMTFYERFANAFHPIMFTLLREYKYFPVLEEITRRGLGEEITKDMPSFKEMERNSSLLFVTTHHSLDYPRSFPPHVIPVGGIVVDKIKKPLPQDMEAFINSSKSGFIYISFGTICEFTKFEESVQIEFINALAQFPEIHFIWKSSTKINATTLPKNVFETKWAPQQTILAHPKIKAFITHAGMGSTVEAIHNSVPVVCIPIMGDQDPNADMIVRKGAGVKVEIVGLKQHQLEDAIREILHNKKYRLAMNTLTSVFKDRPQPPLENAVWWVEYLLRHDTINDFIVPPNVQQPWWKRRQLDIWITAAFSIVGIVGLALFLLYAIAKTIANFAFGDDDTRERSRKKKVKKN